MNRPPDTAVRSDFPPEARLHVPPEYQRAFSEGLRQHGRLFRLHYRTVAGEPARLGVSVSKRVDKRAVARNRIKRLCREFFRHRRHALVGGDYVLVARPEAAAASAQSIRDELALLFTRAVSLKPAATTGTMSDSASPGRVPHGAAGIDPPAVS